MYRRARDRERTRSLFIIALCFVLVVGAFTVPAFGSMTDAEIDSLRQQGRVEGWTFSVGKNPATAYSLDELCGVVIPDGWEKMAPFDPCIVKADLPEKFDWREETGLPPVRNQGQCGSCWAFGTVGPLECNIKIKDGDVVDLSEQWLVSCNRDGGSCGGGWYAFDYFQWKTDNYGDSGAVLEQYFPYAAADLPCDGPYPHDYFIRSWAYIGEENGIPSIEAMKQAIIAHGPIAVLICVGPAFQAYTGGIFNTYEHVAINHAVVLVGWDDTQGTEGVWILRNSWGDGWGEGGYMLIQYGFSMVGYSACYVDYVRAKKMAILDNDIYDDTEGGDGDSIPEAGETVQVVLTFENRYATDLNDVTAYLSFDDARIDVTQNSAFLGVVPRGQTVQNSASPFEIVIPADYGARVDSMYITFVWNGGADRDSQVVERPIGGIPVILVDEDDGDALEEYYQPYLKAKRIPYTIRSGGGTPGPGTSYLDNGTVAVWFTGDYRTNPLSLMDLTVIRDWMNRGGGLFLTGQGIAPQLAVYDPQLLQDYLKSEYLSASSIPILGDDPAGSIFSAGDSVILFGRTGANNQTATDKIMPINGGVGELGYYNNQGLGAVSYSGDYKSLFFSFGFESITDGDWRWQGRDSIMADALNFFGVTATGTTPTAAGLAVLADDPTHVIDETPIFGWQYNDPGSNPQQAYQIQVGDDRFWASAPIWDYQSPISIDTQAVYSGPGLIDGGVYYIRARVFNGIFWSDWTSAEMRTNSVPVPFGLAPDEGQEMYYDAVVLTHTNSVDLEDDSLTYSYELYSDSVLTDLVAQALHVAPDSGAVSSWAIQDALSTDEDYYWRVRAYDGFEEGQWGAAARFHTVSYVIGDANRDRAINIADAVYLITYIFRSGPPPDPASTGDADCSGACNIGDAVYLINYIFRGGPEPGCD